MSRKLPPLNALRTFEAAARHLSFTRAADELYVTQAAVSHQVKALEEYLSIQLFKRLNRALLLTEEGQHYYPAVRVALDDIAQATQSLYRAETSGVLTVSVNPSFASLWLVPRMHRFAKLYPDIDIRIAADDALVDFDRDNVDVAVRYGRGNWPKLHVEKLMAEELFPVCSSRYLEDHPELKTPRGLKGHTLIHDYAFANELDLQWEDWIRKAGVEGVDPSRGPTFSHMHMVMQACLAGEGVALGRFAMIQDDLKAGRLVRLFDFSVKVDIAYYFCCPLDATQRYKVKAFRDWLLSETKDIRARRSGATGNKQPLNEQDHD